MDRPLRFCMITTFYPPYNFGGDGIFVQRLATELARRGHQVEVIHDLEAYRSLVRKRPVMSCDDDPRVTVHGLRSLLGSLSPLATHQTGFPFFKSARIQQILGKGFDVVHFHNISLFGPKILEYGQAIKLYTIQEYWLICPTHTLFRFNRAPCTRPFCLPCTLTYKRPPQWWRYTGLLEAAVKHVDAFIAPSRFCKDKHHQVGLTIPIVHLPHFAPLTEGALPTGDHPVGEKAATPYFLFVGRLEKLKGVQTLIPIFRRYPGAQLWIAGTGSYEPQLRGLAAGSGNIRFLGHLSDQQLRVVYRGAVALIVPSIWYEVFGLVIIEAFSQRTPAVVRNLGGMPELIEESGGGFVYETDKELLAAMDRLLADSSLRHEMGLHGYEAYLKKWTADVHMQAYLELIHDMAAAKAQTAVGTSPR